MIWRARFSLEAVRDEGAKVADLARRLSVGATKSRAWVEWPREDQIIELEGEWPGLGERTSLEQNLDDTANLV